MGAGDIDPAQPFRQSLHRAPTAGRDRKAMSLDPKILQLDEPTSALAQAEVQQLFGLVRRLRDRGVTIIYISHRLAELGEIADTVTALRDGRFTVRAGWRSDARSHPRNDVRRRHPGNTATPPRLLLENRS